MQNDYQNKTKHVSVLPKEVIKFVDPAKVNTYVDATLGGGGHLLKVIEGLTNKEAKIIAFDQDGQAIERFKARMEEEGVPNSLKLFLVNQNFEKLKEVLNELSIEKVDAILADLGTSQDQLTEGERGFSYVEKGNLDMRMDLRQGVTAADLVNGLSKNELVMLFENLADFKFEAKKIANAIVKHRQEKPIKTTQELKSIVRQATYNKSTGSQHLRGPEARVFQALRIAVNHELDSLRQFLPQAFETLEIKGRLIVISFHSGEDRVVKNFFKEVVNEGKAKYLAELITPEYEELQNNPRSSSAKMRVIQKIK